jgi:hypothetical protein
VPLDIIVIIIIIIIIIIIMLSDQGGFPGLLTQAYIA